MCECYATVSYMDPRRELWFRVVPDGRMPLKHPVPHLNDGQLFYEGDTSRLSAEQLEVMAGLLAEKFSLDIEEVRRDLAKGILPVLAMGVTVVVCDLHARCMA